MGGKLLELNTKELLKKFGMGNHKPGSGSAAAFQGLLAAQLIRTVISLTNEEKRRQQYSEWLPELLRMNSDIETRIYPTLEKLCEQDSIQFDRYITRLRERDKETNSQQQQELDRQGMKELVPATEIPLEMATLCMELGEFAIYVFDHGFKSARGDAAVALNGASASVAGCLSIIDLNLSKFGCNDWTLKIRTQAEEVREGWKKLATATSERMDEFEVSCRKKSLHVEITDIGSGRWEEVRLSEKEIEKVARQLQNVMWSYRDIIWNELPESQLDILKPEVALEKLLGYQFKYVNSLGQLNLDGGVFETAGQIDKDQKTVFVSLGFQPEVQNFTAAHELGHALFHKGMVLHRDIALDGSASYNKDFRERQANKFAAFFLMPEKQIKAIFQDLFLTDKFVIDQNSVFELRERSVSDFKAKCRDLHGLARFLATTEFYRGRSFNSISKIFKVSVGAMAIRLEELGLVEF
jgi:Zn-dependent peptidase ImmA (M78 family)/formiminotetrahydrofolate cyclodeaminase